MNTETQYKALTKTNYGTNYNKIFENNDPKVNWQMPVIDKLNSHSSSKLSSKIDYIKKNNKFF